MAKMVDMHLTTMVRADDTERRIKEKEKKKTKRKKRERGTVQREKRETYATYVYHDTNTE